MIAENTKQELNVYLDIFSAYEIQCFDDAKKKGFWDGCTPKNIITFSRAKIADLHTEIDEANQAFSSNYRGLEEKDTFEDELADCIIRAFDLIQGIIEFVSDKSLDINMKNNLEIFESYHTFLNFTTINQLVIYELSSFLSGATECIRHERWNISIVLLKLFVKAIVKICVFAEIDIIKQLEYKLNYNKSRDYRHGKSA